VKPVASISRTRLMVPAALMTSSTAALLVACGMSLAGPPIDILPDPVYLQDEHSNEEAGGAPAGCPRPFRFPCPDFAPMC
jgi:hypothetical protein